MTSCKPPPHSDLVTRAQVVTHRSSLFRLPGCSGALKHYQRPVPRNFQRAVKPSSIIKTLLARARPAPTTSLDTRHHDALLLGVEVEHLDAVFLAEAAVFGDPERKLVVGHLDRVHPGVTGVEPIDPELGALQVAGEDRRAEPELRVVGTLKGFVEVLDPRNRQ